MGLDGQLGTGPAASDVDATTFAVLFHRIESIVQEMSLTLEYSSWSSILSQIRDFSCAVYDAAPAPNALSVFDGLPIHVNAQPVALRGIVNLFGLDEVEDGDVFMVNSIYHGTSHIGDLVVATPVFWEGRHVFWSVATGHQMDVGSSFNTSVPVQATDVWKEGFQMSPVKLESRGEVRKDVLQLYLENMRYREFMYGDLMSQVGSVKTGKRRLLELIEHWGIDTVETFGRQIIRYADERTAAEIERLPDGTYHGESWVDSDGTGQTNIAVRCAMTIDGADIAIDFEGTDPQVRGGVNSSWANCQNAASIPILCCLPADLPHNQGALKHIRVTAPKGTIVHAAWPAATAGATIVPADAISEAVWKCLAQACPERAVAGMARIAPEAVTVGVDRRDPDEHVPFSVIFLNGGSGGGACAEYDGWPMMYSSGTIGALKFVSTELLELQYPLLVHEQQVRVDSMGAGRTRGGPGLQFHVEPIAGAQVDNYPYGDGVFNPPFGMLGGTHGDGGAIYRINADGTRTVFGPISYFRVREGESWIGTSSGGGGYGDPLARDTGAVARDVRDGFVSRDAAERIYGVLFRHAGHRGRRGHDRSGERLAADRRVDAISPTGPDAGTYHKAILGPRDTFELSPLPPTDVDYTL